MREFRYIGEPENYWFDNSFDIFHDFNMSNLSYPNISSHHAVLSTVSQISELKTGKGKLNGNGLPSPLWLSAQPLINMRPGDTHMYEVL